MDLTWHCLNIYCITVVLYHKHIRRRDNGAKIATQNKYNIRTAKSDKTPIEYNCVIHEFLRKCESQDIGEHHKTNKHGPVVTCPFKWHLWI